MQEKTHKHLKTWLRCDHQSLLAFCKKARLPGKASTQLNIVISEKKEQLCLKGVSYIRTIPNRPKVGVKFCLV